jgi:hypothetical protein
MNNKIVAIGLICVFILLVASIVFFYVILPKANMVSQKASSPSPTPTPTPAPINKIQVSGKLSHWDLQFQFTDIEFQDANQTYDTPVQNGSYCISVANQQVYGISGTWGGRTIDVGPPGGTGAILLETFYLNASAGVTSITHDLPALNLHPTPPPTSQVSATATPTATPSVPELSWLVIVPLLLIVLSFAAILRHQKTVQLKQ